MRTGQLLRANQRDREQDVTTRRRPMAEVLAEIIDQCGDIEDCRPIKELAERKLAALRNDVG